ncbi:hypothetical protein DENSPDRAFT_854963 [Dentipellis sp. KUC8613]|nr:hypothetical protein DENSPDRAFT_854963 [Dentipellis sp. KUC8613]
MAASPGPQLPQTPRRDRHSPAGEGSSGSSAAGGKRRREQGNGSDADDEEDDNQVDVDLVKRPAAPGALILLTPLASKDVNETPTQKSLGKRAKKPESRSPLSFVGKFTKSLFGTADETPEPGTPEPVREREESEAEAERRPARGGDGNGKDEGGSGRSKTSRREQKVLMQSNIELSRNVKQLSEQIERQHVSQPMAMDRGRQAGSDLSSNPRQKNRSPLRRDPHKTALAVFEIPNAFALKELARIHLDELLKGASPLEPAVQPSEVADFQTVWDETDGTAICSPGMSQPEDSSQRACLCRKTLRTPLKLERRLSSNLLLD